MKRLPFLFVLLIVLIVVTEINCKERKTRRTRGKGKLKDAKQKHAVDNVCRKTSFKTIANAYIKLGIRWKDPKVKRRDLRKRMYDKRKEVLGAVMKGYCADPDYNETQIYAMDECFSIAFDVDRDVTERCRKLNYFSAEEIKKSDCSDDESQADIGFRECVTYMMRQRKPDFDMYDHKTDPKSMEKAEMKKFLRRDYLLCMVRVLFQYWDDYARKFYL